MEIKKLIKFNRHEKCDVCQNNYSSFYVPNPYSPTGEYPNNEIKMYYFGDQLKMCEDCLERITLEHFDEFTLRSLLYIKKAEQPNARKKYIKKSIPSKVRWEVLKRDNFTCLKCGSRGEDSTDLHADHVMPEFLGGETTPANLQTLCQKCNFNKKTKIVDYRNANDLITQGVNPVGTGHSD